MGPLNFPKLDTLIIRGNSFPLLPEGDSNLFGFGQNSTHNSLSLLDLSDNQIAVVYAKAFEGVPNIEDLYLAKNQIREIQGDIFGKMFNLRRLFLNESLDQSLPREKQEQLIHKMFGETKDERAFENLKELWLNDNNLVSVAPDAFCKLTGLNLLDLNNNHLTTFYISKSPKYAHEYCNQQLNEIRLSGNEMTTIKKTLLNYWNHVSYLDLIIYLDGNPFKCDCFFKNFLSSMDKEHDWDWIMNLDSTLCDEAYPKKFENKKIAEIDYEQLKCAGDEVQESEYMHTVYIFVALALIGLCFLLACFIYNRRRASLKGLRYIDGSLMKRLNSDEHLHNGYRYVGGYHKLGQEESAEIRPEFV